MKGKTEENETFRQNKTRNKKKQKWKYQMAHEKRFTRFFFLRKASKMYNHFFHFARNSSKIREKKTKIGEKIQTKLSKSNKISKK